MATVCLSLFLQSSYTAENHTPINFDNKANVKTIDSTPKYKDLKNPALFCPSGNGFFVLYYGTPINIDEKVKIEGTVDGKRIRSLSPNFVIVADTFYNNPNVAKFFHFDDEGKPTDIRVLSYIATNYGKGKLKKLQEKVIKKIDESMNAGFDGVFFDEVEDDEKDNNLSELKQYYSAISQEVKSKENKLVIFNPGEKNVEDWLFNLADIVSVENDNAEFQSASGKTYPKWRWLSVEGDPSEKAANSFDEAHCKLEHFRKAGGFWYYSPPYLNNSPEKETSHNLLPKWLEEFALEAKKESVNCSEQ